jgi:UDP-glucose 4-epimerase
MKALVTGGAGFIGSHVVDLYVEHGLDVVVVDNLSTGRLSNLNPSARFYQVDIRSPELSEVFQIERPDIVNHHAAQMNVRRSVEQPIFDADVNIVGSLKLIEQAKAFDVKRFVYISTGGAVYGEPVYLPCDETHPINPVCQYGASKHTVEHYLYMYQVNYGLEYTVLRYPNVYGPRQDPNGEAGVIAIFTGQMLRDQSVTINGDGEQQRDYVHVRDCAQANLMAITMPHESTIFNLGSGIGTSVNQIFSKLAEITGYAQKPHHGPAKLGETRHIYLSSAKIHRELGWSPAVSFEQGLADTVGYFQEHEGPQPVQVGGPVQVAEPELGWLFAGAADSDDSPQADAVQPPAVEVDLAQGVTVDAGASKRAVLANLKRTLEGGADTVESLSQLLLYAIEAVGATSGSLLLNTQEGERLGIFAYGGSVRKFQEKRLRELNEHGLSAWVQRHRKAALVVDTREDPRWELESWEEGKGEGRSSLCVPLFHQDTIVGTLTLAHKQAQHLSRSDLALIVAVAGLFHMNRHAGDGKDQPAGRVIDGEFAGSPTRP